MPELTRIALKPEFKNGERPSGEDFENLIESFVNKKSDGVSIEAEPSNPLLQTLVLSRGLRLGDSSANVAGGLRFNSNQLQLFNGTTWVNVSGGGGGGAFQPPPTVAAAAVAHNGNVGIGSFPAAPTFRLEVNLGPNSGPGEQVRFGNVVCANGTGGFAGAAVLSHQGHATSTNYALRQAANGAVHINAASGQPISIRQNGATVRLGVSAAGNVIVGGDSDLPNAPGGSTLQVLGNVHVVGDLTVTGQASKTNGGPFAILPNLSDARVKEDVRDLELGLSELRQVRTVRFRYNGRAGTPAGQAGVGVIGQEIETIIPETIRRDTASVPNDAGLEDLRVFDPSALTFVLINAVKELAGRVDHLEQALAAATASAVPAIK